MFKNPILLSLLGFFFLSAAFAGSEPEGWFPFAVSPSPYADSPANVGKRVLDAPAGKYGFVSVKGTGFQLENGAPIRFWGTNLCFSACFPSKQHAEALADRLAFFGFNAVRFHHMDFFFEPKGIFRDVRPSTSAENRKKTGRLSAGQLDRLDYLIYQLKIRGIYVNMNLLVARHFTEADGVAAADRLGMAAKPVSYFNRRLIELQKSYAKDLLTHRNPYTGMRYCDDPAIAIVEIINESSILDYWHENRLNGRLYGLKKNPIPDVYTKELDQKWRAWLEEKYGKPAGSVSAKRPIFKLKPLYTAQEFEDIVLFYTDLEKKYFDEMTSYLKNDLGVRAAITGIGGHPRPEDMVAQKSCDFIDSHAYWDHPYFPGSGWDKNSFKIANNSMLSDKNLGMAGALKDSAKVDRPFTVSEWNHCYPNQYAYETPVLMAVEAQKGAWDGLFQFAFSHGWDANPDFNSINSYFDTLGNAQQLLVGSIGSLITLRTNTAAAAIQNRVLTIRSADLKGAVGFIQDQPQSLDSFTFTSRQNGAVFLYSSDGQPVDKARGLVLIVAGEIKNQGSGWQNGKFDWGGPPTLLKNMDVSVRLAVPGNFKVYALDPAGKRAGEVLTTVENGALVFSTASSNTPWFEITSI